jgi:hypothetical protein
MIPVPLTLSAWRLRSSLLPGHQSSPEPSTRLHPGTAPSSVHNAGQAVTTSGNYLLAPADSGGARLLRIARSDGTYFN